MTKEEKYITKRKISQSLGFVWKGQNFSITVSKRKVHERKKRDITSLKRLFTHEYVMTRVILLGHVSCKMAVYQ